jgi:hypothetical protein
MSKDLRREAPIVERGVETLKKEWKRLQCLLTCQLRALNGGRWHGKCCYSNEIAQSALPQVLWL